MNTRRWLTNDQAAEYLGVTPATLRRWAREGRIPSHRLPGGTVRRFHSDELDAALGLDVEAAQNWGFTDDGTDDAGTAA